MAWFGSSTRSPIGMDVGARHIRAMQLHRQGGVWRVVAAAALPRTESPPIADEAQLRRFVGLLDRQGFVGRQVVLNVPEPMLFSGQLELPPRGSGAPLGQIAQMELARLHKREPDSFKMDSWDLPASARDLGTTHLMVAGCGHADANLMLDRFESVGLDVVALDTAAWSLARACRPLCQGDTQITGILDLGWSSARLAVLYGGVIIYERVVSEGGLGHLHTSLVDRTGQDPNVVAYLIQESSITGSRDSDPTGSPEVAAEIESHVDVLVQLIGQSFSYASHRYRDAAGQRLVIVGGGAAVDAMCRRLAEAIDFDVTATTLTPLVDHPAGLIPDQDATAFTMALGLSQHGQGVGA